MSYDLSEILIIFIHFPIIALPCTLGILMREYWSNEIYKKMKLRNNKKNRHQINGIRTVTIFMMALFLSILDFGVLNVLFVDQDLYRALTVGAVTGILGYSLMDAIINGSDKIIKMFAKQLPLGNTIAKALEESSKDE